MTNTNWKHYAKVLDLWFEGRSVPEIGEHRGLSRQRIYQMLKTAKQQLAHRVFYNTPPAELKYTQHHRRRNRVKEKPTEEALIKEIEASLEKKGITGLDAKARALGLSRSTTYALFGGARKIGLNRATILRLHQAKAVPAVLRRRIADLHQAHLTKNDGYGTMDPERDHHAEHPPRREDQPDRLGPPKPRYLQVPGRGNPPPLAENLQAEPRPEDQDPPHPPEGCSMSEQANPVNRPTRFPCDRCDSPVDCGSWSHCFQHNVSWPEENTVDPQPTQREGGR